MNYGLSEKTIYAYFCENAKLYANDTALLSERERYTWKQFFEIYNYLIDVFRSWGISKGKTVVIAAPRNVDAPFVIFAAVATEAIVVLSDPNRAVAYFLNDCSAKIDHDFIIRQNAYGVWICEGKDGAVHTFCKTDGVGYAKRANAPMTCDEKTPTYIFFTSGSTGKSKAALLTQYGMINNGRNNLIIGGGTQKDRTMLIMPLYHVFGLQILESNLTMGGCIMIPETRDADYVLDCVEKYKINHLDAVPTYYYILTDAQKRRPREISCLEKGIIAGGAYSAQQFINIEEGLGITLSPSYGMTETATALCFTPVDASREVRVRGIGKFNPLLDCVIRDLDGNIVEEPEKVGEICVRGYCLALGYLQKEGVGLPLDGEGYFHTGDLAYFDENGFLYLAGRCKDMIIRGGENISPLRIANLISEIDGVRDVYVTGVPSEKYGEEVGACIVGENVFEEIVKEHLKERLPKNEIPSVYLFVNKMPSLSGTGKPDRNRIIKELTELLLHKN